LARRRKGRALDGVLILDKPQGFSSNGVLQKVRRLFTAQKGGHTGSLDPLATGVLPICLGEATKFSKYLLDADKGYFTTATLGEIRTTGDSEGEVVATNDVPVLSAAQLDELLLPFRGDIKQVPSMYSALKHEGRPLYEYARKGIEIERPARPVTIFQLELTEQRESELDLTVECSKGTYIRSLVEDIGKSMGCGAHVSMLRRFKAGHFSLDQAVTLERLEACDGDNAVLDAFLLPVDALLPNLPRIFVNSALGSSILHGQAVRIPPSEITGLCRLYTEDEKAPGSEVFAGVVTVSSDGEVKPERLVNFSASDTI